MSLLFFCVFTNEVVKHWMPVQSYSRVSKVHLVTKNWCNFPLTKQGRPISGSTCLWAPGGKDLVCDRALFPCPWHFVTSAQFPLCHRKTCWRNFTFSGCPCDSFICISRQLIPFIHPSAPWHALKQHADKKSAGMLEESELRRIVQLPVMLLDLWPSVM